MSLIEQLGGYTSAKNIQGCREVGGLPVDHDLEKSLLEYRRENGIFEVGDDVIYTILGDSVVKYDEFLKTQNQDWIRHATDYEIKAGKRLP